MNYYQKHAESVKQLTGFYRLHYYVNLLQLKTDGIVFLHITNFTQIA